MQKIKSILNDASRELKIQNIETSRLDSEILLAYALGESKEYLVINSDNSLNDQKISKFRSLIRRRADGESISNIIGKREFYGREFIVNCHVLDPRPDTELIIDIIREIYIKEESFSILDLGTGSGCILTSILLEFPNSVGIGTDISENALNTAKINSEKYLLNDRAAFILSDWVDAIDVNKFDIIVSNPPYIPSADLEFLQPEVLRNDPLIALDGGINGLIHYKKIISRIENMTNSGGKYLIMEIYTDLAEELVQLLIDKGFKIENIEIRYDLSKRKRAIYLKF